jgi:hypothetical protein
MEDDENRMLVALGKVSESGTTMEWVLRLAFQCLVGSKYAAVVAGGQPVGWLIAQCIALTRSIGRSPRTAGGRYMMRCLLATQ